MKPMGEEHLAILRRHMVEVVDIHFDLVADEIGRDALEPAVREAMLKAPRHIFVPAQIAAFAYHDRPLPIGFDKTISQPFIAALMLDLLDVRHAHRTLEVGTGLGYQAAILAELGAHVWTVEIVEEFAEAARARLTALGYGEVVIRSGDGARGWPDQAPFDRILVTAAAPAPPEALIGQLADGGKMVIPLGSDEVQQLSLVVKQPDGTLDIRHVMPTRFTRLELA